MNKPPIPLNTVPIGALITPKINITGQMVKHWEFSSECGVFSGTLLAGTARLEVVEKSPYSLNAWPWVKVQVLGISPACVLKLTAAQYTSMFCQA